MKAHKEINSIRPFLDKLVEKMGLLEEQIERREEVFNDRSEKWQESEKGQDHELKTQEMNDLFIDIEDKLQTLQSTLDELEEITE